MEGDEGRIERLTAVLSKSDPQSIEFAHDFVQAQLRHWGDLESYVDAEAAKDTGAADEDIAKLIDTMSSVIGQFNQLPGTRLRVRLDEGRSNSIAPITWSDPSDPLYRAEPSKWPTGCNPIDTVSGGGYGMTVVAGAPKVGKSLLAISSAIEAARAGWSVVYVNAEMSEDHVLMRFQNYMGRFDPAVGERLHIANVGPGVTIERLFEEIAEEAISADTIKLLIVLDSINRIVDFSGMDADSESGYWTKLAEWSAWAMNSRRSTDGRISWLVVSELNSQGMVKGRNLEYTADMVIRMASGGLEDIVDIDIPYSRATRAATIGPAYRDFAKGRFLIHE